MKLFGKERALIVIQKLAEMHMTHYFFTLNQKIFSIKNYINLMMKVISRATIISLMIKEENIEQII